MPVEPLSLLGLLTLIVTSLIGLGKMFVTWFMNRELEREVSVRTAAKEAHEHLIDVLKEQIDELKQELKLTQVVLREAISDKQAVTLRLQGVEKELELIKNRCKQCAFHDVSKS